MKLALSAIILIGAFLLLWRAHRKPIQHRATCTPVGHGYCMVIDPCPDAEAPCNGAGAMTLDAAVPKPDLLEYWCWGGIEECKGMPAIRTEAAR